MKAETLKKSILQYAMQGKLVAQDPNDEPASELLKRIKTEKEQLIKDGKIKKEKPLPPITADEIPYELPKGWEWVRLGEIGDWGSGSTPNKAKFDYYRNGTINWLKTGDLNDGYINEIPEKITEVALQETSVKIKPAGSLLIAMYGATIGKLGILNIPSTTNQACCACIKYADINIKYLFYYLLSERDNLRKKGEGGAQPNISREKIIAYLLPLPPLAEQQRIVEKLEEILPLVEEYGKNEEILSEMNKKLPKQIRQSILQYAVQGKLVEQNPNDEPASELLKRIKAEKEQLIKDGKIKKEKSLAPISEEEIPYELPQGWEWVRLGNIINISSGKFLPSNEMKTEGTIPVYGGNGINGYHDEYLIDKPSLIIGRVGFYCGCVHLSTGKAWVTDNAFITTFSENNININFLKLLLVASNLGKNDNATAQPVVSGKKIYPIVVALPPLAEQQRIVAKVEELMQIVDKLE